MKKLQATALFCTLTISTSALLASDQGSVARSYIHDSTTQFVVGCVHFKNDVSRITAEVRALLSTMGGKDA